MTVERKGEALPAESACASRLPMREDRCGRSVGITMADDPLLSAGRTAFFARPLRLRPTSNQGRFDAQLQKGSLSVISGRMAKQSPEAMTVRTPSVILGVRGRNSCCPRMTRHLIHTLAMRAPLAAIVAGCQTGTVVLLPAADGKDPRSL